MLKLARNISEYSPALKTLIAINIRTNVFSTKMGRVWWILDPLIMMGIYYFLVKGIFGRGGENYHVFVLCGIVSWQFFTRALTGTINVIEKNKQLIRQIQFPLTALIAVPVATYFFFALIGTFLIMLFSHSVISLHTMAIIPLLILISMLSYGIGLFASILNMHFGDIRQLISYALRAGFFLTPVIYPASRLLESPNIPEAIKLILQLNPMMWILTASREVLIDGKLYDWSIFAIHFAFGLILIQLGLLWVRASTAKILKMI